MAGENSKLTTLLNTAENKLNEADNNYRNLERELKFEKENSRKYKS